MQINLNKLGTALFIELVEVKSLLILLNIILYLFKNMGGTDRILWIIIFLYHRA